MERVSPVACMKPVFSLGPPARVSRVLPLLCGGTRLVSVYSREEGRRGHRRLYGLTTSLYVVAVSFIFQVVDEWTCLKP